MHDSFPDISGTTTWWLIPDRFFDGQQWIAGKAIYIKDQRIAAIEAEMCIPKDDPRIRTECLVSPGYVDLQVNGGGGALFNNDPMPDTLALIGDVLWRRGTTSWLPTLISDSADKLDLAIDAVISMLGSHGVVGIHVEGPHINIERKGTHSSRFIRPFDERTALSLQRLRSANVPTLFTAAPEYLPDGTIEQLHGIGVVVSAGHTAAKAADIQSALQSGLACFTHLHNAMTPMTSREPGVVGAALDSDAWCGMIVDGHHVSDVMCRLSIRSRNRPDRTFVVSDSMATVGGPDEFMLFGELIRLRDGKLVNSAGSLAGAHIDMATSVQRLTDAIGVKLDQALSMATSIPAGAINLMSEIGCLKIGAKADFLLLDKELSVKAAFRGGRQSEAP